MSWEILSTEIVARTPRFDLVKEDVRLPGGKVKELYLTSMRDASVIFPVTADGKIVMLNEYRHPCRTRLLSLPGGQIEDGDTPLEAAKRELLEETGYTAEDFEFVQEVFADPPRTGRKWHFFIARDAKPIAEQDLTEFEDLEVILMSPHDMIDQLMIGKVANLPDMGLMYLGLHRLGFLK